MWLIFGLSIPDYFKDKPYLHIPLIETSAVEFDIDQVIENAKSADAILITSKEAVKFLEPLMKSTKLPNKVICVGPKTFDAAKKISSKEFYLPKTYDQEGTLELVKELQIKHVLYPRAKSVRPFLENELLKAGVKCSSFICYQTFSKKTSKPLPLECTGYFFSSPSTVEAFKEQFEKIEDKQVVCIGHVTAKKLRESFDSISSIEIIDPSLI